MEQLPHSQVLVTSLSGSVSESSLHGIAVLPDVTKIVMDTLNQRFQLRILIEDDNFSNYLEMVRLLLRFGVNGIVNFGLVSGKSSEEIIRSLNGLVSLRAIFMFISDFLAHYITLYFDKKFAYPLLFTISVAASIRTHFPQLAEDFLIQKFVNVFTVAIDACVKVCDTLIRSTIYLILVLSRKRFYAMLSMQYTGSGYWSCKTIFHI